MFNILPMLLQYQAFYDLNLLSLQMASNSSTNLSQNSENQQIQKVGFVPVKIDESTQPRKPKVALSKEDLQSGSLPSNKKPWTEEEDNLLRYYVEILKKPWSEVPELIEGRNEKMCYSRYRRLSLEAKQYWKRAQDEKILELVEKYGESWRQISSHFEGRSSKQIRQHYLNFLRPNINKDGWSVEQDMKIVELMNQHGKKWKFFETLFEGRTENQIKNRYYGRIKKLQMKKQKKRVYKY